MPKRVGYLYDKMVDRDFIRAVILEAAKGRQSRKDIARILADLDGYVEKTYEIVATESFVPSEPRVREIYDESSEKFRKIKMVPFWPDGVIQWMMVTVMKPVLMRGMHPWSCASIPGRGGKRVHKKISSALRNDPNGAKNGYAWCDCFADYCYIYTLGLSIGMAMTYQPEKGLGAGCTYSMRYYKNAGAFFKTPQRGDQIFFTNDGGDTSYHTGIVEKVTADRVYTIEGNTSSAAGVVPNGGCVRDKSYPRNAKYIAGYGRPNWDLVKEEESMPEMTQDKFNEMFKVAMAAYRAELQDNDCGNFSADGRKFVTESGLLVGGNTLPNGEANFMWQDFLTREQFATVLYRFAQKFGLN